jgi:tRNA1Val (adenine37-N6)-methyltransferase
MFRFKQFTIQQDRAAMKIGTDSVLLGAWADIAGLGATPTVLDIGTGTGVLALMLAQRLAAQASTNFEIDAVEIDKNAAQEATENAANSPWAAHIQVFNTAIQAFQPQKKYDVIISNPPYFNDSLGAKINVKTTERRIARHTDALNYDDFLAAAERLLLPKGSIFLILPAPETDTFLAKAIQKGFVCNTKTVVFGRVNKPPERCLLALSYPSENSTKNHETLVIYGEGQGYTDAYKALTKNFYL